MNRLPFWIAGGIIAIVLLLMLSPFAVVNTGHKGVVLRFGKLDRVLDEGVSYKTPLFEKVREVDIRTQKGEVSSSAASKDLQTVTAKVAINFNVMPDKVGELWKNIGQDYQSKVIAPAIQEAIKAATAKYTAEELITKREIVRDEIKTNIRERLASQYIVVSEVFITDFDFSTSFNAAIEAKVTAEQKAKEAENKLKQVEAEAKQSVAKAQAEAESIRLQSEAANNEKFIELRRLEVQLETAKKWNGQLPQNLYGSAPIPFLQLTK